MSGKLKGMVQLTLALEDHQDHQDRRRRHRRPRFWLRSGPEHGEESGSTADGRECCSLPDRQCPRHHLNLTGVVENFEW